ncbi:S26 family signal peptidase [Streptomyces sp. C]|uniref:S26 family signal peptidase n=1 Tax=Streptomyces sp. C TaxID=253839 RepID=UPI0001B5834D|nr:S26 family signal peptidase [Streptomyces sp. C]EFL19456.1 nickel-type superoxide dismutase maturation protease [Streptomyces sp. C]
MTGGAVLGVTALTTGALVWGALWLRRSLVVVRVSGSSMSPDYEHGDRVLMIRRGTRTRLRPGRFVVLDRALVDSPAHADPGEGLFLKRLVAAPGDRVPAPFTNLPAFRGEERVPRGCYLVLGSHPASVDSKQWGYVRAEALSGVVLTRPG